MLPNKIKNYLICLLIVIIGLFWLYTKMLQNHRDKLVAKTELMENRLNRLINITGPLLYDKFKKVDGEVKVKKTYVPPEGKISVKVTEPKENGSFEVKTEVSNKGFTFRPGVGFYYHGRPRVVSSNKVLYWGRYSGIVNINDKGLFLGVSRYVDDLVPFWNPKNLEMFLSYQVVEFSSREGSKLKLGIRITL